jgi:hypothetical protein
MSCRPFQFTTAETIRSSTQTPRNRLGLLPSAVRPNGPLQRNRVMRILIATIMICGACFVLLIGLLSVVRDLLMITSRHAPSESDSLAVGREGPALRAKVSEDVQ